MASPNKFCTACGTQITDFHSPFCPKCLVRYPVDPATTKEVPLVEMKGRVGGGVDPKHAAEVKTKFFHAGESLVAIFLGSDPGLGFFKQYLVITDQRVIFWKRGVTEVNKIFTYDDIGAAGEYRSLLSNALELNIKGAKEIFPYMDVSDLSLAVSLIREFIHFNKNRPSGTIQVSIPEQIKKLAELRDSGILTEQEFTTKKTELLKRL